MAQGNGPWNNGNAHANSSHLTDILVISDLDSQIHPLSNVLGFAVQK